MYIKPKTCSSNGWRVSKNPNPAKNNVCNRLYESIKARLWFGVTAGGIMRSKQAVVGQWGTRAAWQGAWGLGNWLARLEEAI